MRQRVRIAVCAVALLRALAACTSALGGDHLAAPVPISVRGQALELTDPVVGPMLGDLDGDGRKDLLVGQHRGKLRVFRNLGAEGRPDFADPVWFDEMVSGGTIPLG